MSDLFLLPLPDGYHMFYGISWVVVRVTRTSVVDSNGFGVRDWPGRLLGSRLVVDGVQTEEE